MDSLIIEGKIIQKFDVQEGVSSRGPWKKQDFILETSEQFPKKVCISCWGEKLDELNNYAVEDSIRVAINIESREYNQRWYTDVKAWKFESLSQQSGGDSSPAANEDVIGMSFSEEDDELPF
jgi:hypothetical protein